MNTLDLDPGDAFWGHGFSQAADIRLHYVRQGTGPTLILLHGWPGFWYDWRRMLPELARDFDVVAPDLRGFGDSDWPDLDPREGNTPQALALDTVRLMDALGIQRAVFAAHDIGATVAQELATQHAERVAGLVLGNPPYPGIGARRFEPGAQREFWYQHFHQLPLAEALAGRDRESVSAYLGHFYFHWASERSALRPAELEAIFGKYSRPGAFRASIAYYRARAAGRSASAAPAFAPVVRQPTIVLWGEDDPVIPVAWSDRLGEYFADFELRRLSQTGHFVPLEAPLPMMQALHDLSRRLLTE